MLPRPRHRRRVPDREQQLELLAEELVVVAEVVAEQRERLDERAAAGHDLRSTVRQQIDGRELLEDAHRIVGADHVDGARQPDLPRTRRGGCKHDRGRGDDEVGAVVLSDAEDVEADGVRELDLVHQVANPPRGRNRRPGNGIGRQLAEGVDAEFHYLRTQVYHRRTRLRACAARGRQRLSAPAGISSVRSSWLSSRSGAS